MKMVPRFYLYPVPEAPHTLLFEVVRDLPEDDWLILSATVVAVADPMAAIYLRSCFPERPLGRDGTEVLDPCEVWIEEDERGEAERLLREACPSPALWFHVLQVAFDDPKAHRALSRVYTDLTSVPHAAPAGGPGGFDTLALVQAL